MIRAVSGRNSSKNKYTVQYSVPDSTPLRLVNRKFSEKNEVEAPLNTNCPTIGHTQSACILIFYCCIACRIITLYYMLRRVRVVSLLALVKSRGLLEVNASALKRSLNSSYSSTTRTMESEAEWKAKLTPEQYHVSVGKPIHGLRR